MKATVVFLIKDNKILLARKMKKIGAGLWNGYGGKPEPKDISIRHTACRELYEESGMGIITEPDHLIEVADIDFYKNKASIADFSVVFYISYLWSGEAGDTEEMKDPTWFTLDDIPYGEMLPADRDFMPKILDKIINTDSLDKNKEIKNNTIIKGKVNFSEDMKSVLRSEYN